MQRPEDGTWAFSPSTLGYYSVRKQYLAFSSHSERHAWHSKKTRVERKESDAA